MPITVKHTKVSTIPDDADTSLVRPSDWNADHTLAGLGTMAEQNANAVAITGGTATLTSVTTPIVQATNSAGLALRNSAGTTQMSMGAGGGDNITVSVPIAITPANALVNISPTGTGTVTINPTASGTINNVTIGATTAAAGSFTSVTTVNFVETVFAVTGTTPALSPTNGTIQTWTLSGASTPTAGTWTAGASLSLQITASTNTITWSSVAVTWIGGSAPTLSTTVTTNIELWKIGSTIYGALVGNA
jgi:hypothetical protein